MMCANIKVKILYETDETREAFGNLPVAPPRITVVDVRYRYCGGGSERKPTYVKF